MNVVSRLRKGNVVSIVLFALYLVLCCDPAWAVDGALLSRLKGASGGGVKISYHARTGMVRFFGADVNQPLAMKGSLPAGATAEEVSRAFLGEYGALFGIESGATELKVMRVRTTAGQRHFVRFQQQHRGVPVLGGELIVQTDRNGNVISANGEVSPFPTLDVTPAVAGDDAIEKARVAAAKWYGLDPAGVEVSKPALWIYNPAILGPGRDHNSLVWRMDVTVANRRDVRELVLVDAKSGFIALHFNQVNTARNRLIYDKQNVREDALPGSSPARTEGQAETGIEDVDRAYDYSGDVYDFYQNHHGRDGIDGAGMDIVQTVRFCWESTMESCPYENAFWDGSQMVYGEGFCSAEDVVGHEMTHGVTEHESHLFYYMQSGAINESLSDIWGEFIELTYHPGDASERWLLGEDLPIGAIRSMKNPPDYSGPDKMSSDYYSCEASLYGDNGGVHTNCGVGNKAAYLLTDGGAFNGRTVNGLGIGKVADLYYEAQTNLLTSASDYGDLYDCLQQAAANLGWSVDERQQVKNACDAVEMNAGPSGCSTNEAPVCDDGPATDVFYDDLENASSGNWTHGAISGADEWYYPQNANPYDFDATYATSGATNIWGYSQPYSGDCCIAMNRDVFIPSGAYLRFNHSYAFESFLSLCCDGGVVEYSADGGGTWNDAGSLFVDNGYNGTITNKFDNPLGGRSCFSGDSYGYVSSRLNLSPLTGKNVRFRFRIGTDTFGDYYGWFIDDVRIYTCDCAASAIGLTPSNATVGAGDAFSMGLTVREAIRGADNVVLRVLVQSPQGEWMSFVPTSGGIRIKSGIRPALVASEIPALKKSILNAAINASLARGEYRFIAAVFNTGIPVTLSNWRTMAISSAEEVVTVR